MLVLIILAMLLSPPSTQADPINMTEYHRMPPLAIQDDYYKCVEETEQEAVYCLAVSTIEPNRNNSVWNLIESFSRDTKRHFRHDIMSNGICINPCLKQLANLTQAQRDELLLAPFEVDYRYFQLAYNGSAPPIDASTVTLREKFGKQVTMCVNQFLLAEYGLKSFSLIVQCSGNKSDDNLGLSDFSLQNVFFFLFIGIITLLVIVASYLDRDPFVENEASTTRFILLSAFSLQRNWSRLVAIPRTTRGKDLRFIHTIRFLTIFVVIAGHAVFLFTRVPISNPDYYEKKYHSVLSMLQLGATHIVQTFFLISGFLLGLAFADATVEHRNFSRHFFWIAIVYRYLRLTPVYALVLLFETTSLLKPMAHPFWRQQSLGHLANCRQTWWANLLYVNNFMISNVCMPHTWYLSSDFQNFVIAVAILTIIWTWPRLKVPLLSIYGIAVFLAPAFVTYFLKLEGTYIASPEDFKYHWFQESFQDYYVPFYTNGGNYFIGLVIGMHYDRMYNVKMTKRCLRTIVMPLWCLIIPLGITPLLLSYIFYAYDFEKPAMWIFVYVVVTKHLWGLLAIVLLFVFVHRCVPLVLAFFNSQIFVPLGRLVYCIYLVHLIVERFVVEDRGVLVHLTNFTLLTTSLTNLILSTLIALFLCLFIEFPTSALFKALLRKEGIKQQMDEGKTSSEEVDAPEMTEMMP